MDVIEWLRARHLPDKIKISMRLLAGFFGLPFMVLLSLYSALTPPLSLPFLGCMVFGPSSPMLPPSPS